MTSPIQDPGGLTAKKAALRIKAAQRRDALHDAGDAAAEEIARLFLETWSPAPGTVVSAFWPFRSEVDPRPLIHRLHERGCAIVLPVVVFMLAQVAFIILFIIRQKQKVRMMKQAKNYLFAQMMKKLLSVNA